MAPVGVIYDLEKKHGVTMIMIQGTAKTNKTIEMYKKNTTKWKKNNDQKGTKQTQSYCRNYLLPFSRPLIREALV